MKTATVRDLKHDFGKIESWILSGEQVLISKRGKNLMEIRPVSTSSKSRKTLNKINFEEVQKKIWGNRRFSPAEIQAMQDLADEENS